MSKKIYISPSNQNGNLYAAGNTNECDVCNKIANAAKTALERCGFAVKKSPKGQDMRVSIKESNDWGADLHIPIHTNAGGGSGTVVFVYNTSDEILIYANPIYNAVQKISPGTTNYGVRPYPQLAELNSTTAKAVYVEVDFHDNPKIAQWLIDNTNEIGEAICKGVCEAYDISYIPQKDIKKSIYRVQVGAFSNKTNAESFLAKIKAAGFSDAFVVEVEK